MNQPEPATLKRTPLYESHKSLGARLIDFGGWEMPVQYSGIIEEHSATRNQAGLFDLCHMGRLQIRGERHKDFLHHLLTNNVHDLEPGRARYSLVVNEEGYALDDILIYADADSTFVVVNASNLEKIINHFNQHAGEFGVTVENLSDSLAMIAIQGPESVAITNPHASTDLDSIPYYGHDQVNLLGFDIRVARTGYTGEDGFEFYVPSEQAADFWDKLLAAGKEKGLLPVGLGARDTLRLEASMPLYGHEIDEETTPLEAGLRFAVKLKKDPSYIGQAALVAAKEKGPSKVLVGLECLDKRVPRQGYAVVSEGQEVGVVVSGTASPSLGKNIAQAYVPPGLKEPGTELLIRIRGKDYPAVVISRPFYKRPQ